MKTILLTKNILAEQSLQAKLQHLGHEVFVTSNELINALNSPFTTKLISQFDIIILSESLTNLEIKKLAANFSDSYKMILRLSSGQEEERLKNINYFEIGHSIDHLREKMAESTIVHSEKIEIERTVFSVKEQQLYDYVKLNVGEAVSKDILCNLLWKEKLNNSRKSQLSSLVKKINTKLKNFNPNYQIQTVWRKGYKFVSL